MQRDLVLPELPLPTAATPRRAWAELHGSALCLAAAEAAARHTGPVCVIAASAADAERFERELMFFGSRGAHRFPDYETLPYEPISPPQDLLADRLRCLYRLARGERETLVVEAGALLARLPPPDFIVSRSLHLAVGDQFEHAAMIKRLSGHGYLRVEQVAEPGDFAVRGAVFDVFPAGSDAPVRIDLFDNEIETLRTFDPQTQLSAGKRERIEILPAREFPFDDAAIKSFRERFRDLFPVEPGRCPVYRMISDAQLPAGIEYYLPLFFTATSSLFDYLGDDTLFVIVGDALGGLDAGWQMIEERYEQLRGDIERPILAPKQAFFSPAELRARIDTRPTLTLLAHASPDADTVNAGATHALAGGIAPTDDRIERWITAGARRAHFARDVIAGSSRDAARAAARPRLRAARLRRLARVRHRIGSARCNGRRARRRLTDQHAKAARNHRHGLGPRATAATPTQAARTRPGIRDSRADGSAYRRAGRARGLRRRPLPRAHDARRRRSADRVPAARVRGRRQALRSGAEPAPRDALHGRVGRGSAAAPARHGSVGQGQEEGRDAGARHGGRAAEPVCATRRAHGNEDGLRRRQLPALLAAVPVRGDRGSASRDRPRAEGLG